MHKVRFETIAFLLFMQRNERSALVEVAICDNSQNVHYNNR